MSVAVRFSLNSFFSLDVSAVLSVKTKIGFQSFEVVAILIT